MVAPSVACVCVGGVCAALSCSRRGLPQFYFAMDESCMSSKPLQDRGYRACRPPDPMADQVQRSVWVRVRTFITRPTARWPLWWVVAWCALLAVAAYANTITHHFSYDDRAAVAYNQDVRPDTPWIELFKHDFWGGPLGQE